MTAIELQLALANLLPDKISHCEHTNFGSDGSVKNHSFFWKIKTDAEHRMFERDRAILATEWLHVVWLIEQTFDATRQAYYYVVELRHVIAPLPPRGLVGDFRFVNASWQQRAEAIIKLKAAKPRL